MLFVRSGDKDHLDAVFAYVDAIDAGAAVAQVVAVCVTVEDGFLHQRVVLAEGRYPVTEADLRVGF